jgi:acyl-CoA reductase-like NAD-dependent aldehyde dehydrogenase
MGSISSMDLNAFANIVDGKTRSSGTFYHGIDPTTGTKLWDVPVATKQDLEDAVVAARNAFESWSVLPFEERRKLCAEFGELYKANLEYFDGLIRIECAKPVSRIMDDMLMTRC